MPLFGKPCLYSSKAEQVTLNHKGQVRFLVGVLQQRSC